MAANLHEPFPICRPRLRLFECWFVSEGSRQRGNSFALRRIFPLFSVGFVGFWAAVTNVRGPFRHLLTPRQRKVALWGLKCGLVTFCARALSPLLSIHQSAPWLILDQRDASALLQLVWMETGASGWLEVRPQRVRAQQPRQARRPPLPDGNHPVVYFIGIHQKPTLRLFQSCSLIFSHFILEATSSHQKRGSGADRMKATEMQCRREKEKRERETTYEAA